MPIKPIYFEDAKALHRWLTKNAATASELVVGFKKSSTFTPGMSWPEAVDEALCVGWIDGVRNRIDDERYTIRFTPRKPGSNWSAVNIQRIAELQAEGRVTKAGAAAFAQRTEAKSRTASYEQETPPEFEASEIRQFKKRAGAWEYYQSLPPSYRKKVTWWAISAKQPATREKRLLVLVQACAERRRL